MSTKYNVREMRLVVIDTDEYIDADEAARILGIKRSGMSQLCREGRFSRMVRIRFWGSSESVSLELYYNDAGKKEDRCF